MTLVTFSSQPLTKKSRLKIPAARRSATTVSVRSLALVGIWLASLAG